VGDAQHPLHGAALTLAELTLSKRGLSPFS
jgi:hypothetical protein